MIEQSVRLTKNCSQCQSPIEGWAVQIVRENRLRWELEWACAECGNWHDGGWGPAPEAVRDAILNVHGYHRLKISLPDPPTGKALKAFRDAMSMSLSEARESALEALADGYRGTYVETTLIKDLLKAAGISSTVSSD